MQKLSRLYFLDRFKLFTFSNIGLDALECDVDFYSRVNDNILKWTTVTNFKVGQAVDVSENFLVNCTHNERKWFVFLFCLFV